jgi:pyridoxamine 5'-phosphate oxidase
MNADDVLNDVWPTLARAATDRHDPLHTMQVATRGLQGEPRVRTIVLRSAEQASAQLIFHSDLRCAKISEMRAEPRVELHAYDPARRLQLRLTATAMVHAMDALSRERWAASQRMSQRCYYALEAPGTPVNIPPGQPDWQEEEAGITNFAVVVCTIQALDWLRLDSNGNQRIIATLSQAGWTGNWVTP